MPRRTLTELEWLERLQDHAITRGGRLLSDDYLGTRSKHWWQCRAGHAFHAAAANVLHHGSWCPFCAGNARLTIDVFQAIADAHGGELLPYDGPIDRSARPTFRCASGHKFQLHFQNYQARRHGWCLACEREAQHEAMASRLQRAAELAGYVLLRAPSSYSSFHHERALFRCPAGHEWLCRDWEFRIAGNRCGDCWRQIQRQTRRD